MWSEEVRIWETFSEGVNEVQTAGLVKREKVNHRKQSSPHFLSGLLSLS